MDKSVTTILLAILYLISLPIFASEPQRPDEDGCYSLDQPIPPKAGEHKVSDGLTVTENVGFFEEWASHLTPEDRKKARWCPSRVKGISR